jgi:RNA polymerase sigma-70 factor (sigma-B/F/G subfamily)
MNLSITTWTDGDRQLLRVGGVIDFASAPYLRHAVFELFDRGRHHIVLDLGDVRLVDAGALRVLLQLQARAEEHGGSLRAAGAAGAALTAMEVTGVAKQLGAYDAADRSAPECTGERIDLDLLRFAGHWPPGVTADLARLHTSALHPAEHRRRRDAIVESCMPAVRRIARRYSRTTEPLADLEQVAYVGLLKAVDGFDPQRSLEFGPYASSTVVGELKRHFRDRAWGVRVPRRLQERWLAVTHGRDELAARLGRAPTARDVAEHLGLDEEAVVEALELAHTYRPLSLDLPAGADEGEATLLDRLGGEDPRLSGVDYRESLQVLLPRLPRRAQRILALRFYGGLAQHEIADQVGLSQMQVSRILRQSLATLRRQLEEH